MAPKGVGAAARLRPMAIGTAGSQTRVSLPALALALASVAWWLTAQHEFLPPPSFENEACTALRARARPLPTAKALRFELHPGFPHYFELKTNAGTILEIFARQELGDLSLALFDGRCRVRANTDELLPLDGTERLIVESRKREQMLLVVAAVKNSPKGAFTLHWQEHEANDGARSLRLRRDLELNRWLARSSSSFFEPAQSGGEVSEDKMTATLRQLHEVACRAKRCGKAIEVALEIGRHYRRQGRLGRAGTVLTLALEFSKNHNYSRGVARSLHALGLVAASGRRTEEQLEHYRAALAAAEEAPDPRLQALILTDLGVALRRMGRAAEAADAYRQSLALALAHEDPEAECLAANGLGVVEQALGREAEAEGLYSQAATACDRADRHGEAIRARCMLSDARISRADFAGSRLALEEALSLAGTLGDPGSQGLVAFYRGRLALRSFDLESASVEYREAQKAFSKVPALTSRRDLPFQQTLLDLAWVEYLDGEPAVAMEALRQAEVMLAQGEDPRLAATLHLMLGVVTRDVGETKSSMDHLEKAFQLASRASLPTFQIQSEVEIGETLRSQNQLDLAEQHLRNALRLTEREKELGLLPAVQARLSLVERDRGKLEQARATLEGALSGFESYRGKLQDPESRISYVAARQRFYQEHVDLLVRLSETVGRRGLEAEAFHASERSRARGLLEFLAESAAEVRSDLPAELAAEEHRLEAQLSGVGREILALMRQPRQQREQLQALEDQLAATEARRKELERRVRASDPRYAALKYPQPLGLAAVQSLLRRRPGTVLLEYSLGENRANLFVVAADELITLPLSSSAEIRASLDRFRNSQLADDEGVNETTALASYEVFEAVLAPAMPHLERLRPQHLIVVPDGDLFYLPFETLLTERPAIAMPPRYLLERWPISYVPSATVLGRLEQQPGPRTAPSSRLEWVAFGAPDYREARTSPALIETTAPARGRAERGRRLLIPKLVGAEREVETVRALFARPEETTVVYLGAEANEGNVKSLEVLSRARRVHFAVHAFTDDRDPAYYGLILALNQPGEDGVLRVPEIFRLRLNAELVVLSACSSGLGERVRGEGLVGLTQAFFYAGARTLLVSLWQVDDQVTADLMRLFYADLLAGSDPATALRKAKLDMLSARPRLAPRLWAPFIVIGDTR